MHNSDHATANQDLDEVNLKEIFYALKQSKLLIVCGITAFTLVGIAYSLWLPKIWTSSALLTVSESSNSSFSSSSSMGGLASLASLGGMSNGKSQKGSKAIAIVQSREFFDHLLSFDEVLANLMAFKSFDFEENITKYEASYDSEKKSWITSKPPNWLAYKIYKKTLAIDFDNKTGFVTMSVSHQSPVFAKSFLELIIRELNLLSRNRALDQSQASLEYLYEELSSSQLSDVKIAISQLIETQLKTQMLARVKIDYSLESIDRPYFPNERSSPQRKKITFFALFLGLFFSIFFVLLKFFLQKNLES